MYRKIIKYPTPIYEYLSGVEKRTRGELFYLQDLAELYDILLKTKVNTIKYQKLSRKFEQELKNYFECGQKDIKYYTDQVDDIRRIILAAIPLYKSIGSSAQYNRKNRTIILDKFLQSIILEINKDKIREAFDNFELIDFNDSDFDMFITNLIWDARAGLENIFRNIN